MTRWVMTFYRFTPMGELCALRERLQKEAAEAGLKGTILLAQEGINGTLTGERAALERIAAVLRTLPGLADLPVRFSSAREGNPVFYRLKVRIRPEIVALGQPDVDPAVCAGEHVDVETWHALLDDPDVLVIDTRNDYEVGIGTFPGAVNPRTRTFREFADFVAGIDPTRQPRVAMFCTGGIRCEKASAYMLKQGFEAVYQLDGGVLGYLERVPAEENRWQGECFVFDQRVAVNRALEEGSYEQCFACRRPLTADDLAHPHYERGISCPHCVGELEPRRRAAFEERQRQVQFAARRGQQHVGQAMPRPVGKR